MRISKVGLALAALAIAACNVVPHRGTISAYTISGHVIDADSGQPIAGAFVCAKYAKLDAQYYVPQEVVTDADGRFLLPARSEVVTLLDRPDAGATPSVSALHRDYAPVLILVRDFTQDRDITIRMHKSSERYLHSSYINCSTRGGAR